MKSLKNLEMMTEETLDNYRKLRSDDLPTSKEKVQEIMKKGEPANQEDIEKFLEEQTEFYDNLLDTDYGKLTDDLNERIRYESNRDQIIKDIPNPINAGFTLLATPLTLGATLLAGSPEFAIPISAAGVTYSNYKVSEITNDRMFMPGSNVIGVSNDQTSKPDAYKILASELFHSYQFEENSDTWYDSFLREGLERASSIKALEQRYPDKADAFKTYVLLKGSFQANEIADKNIVNGLDLDEQIADRLHSEAEDFKHTEYNLPASLIYAVEETEGEEIYGELFNGDYGSMEEELEFMDGNASNLQRAKSALWKTLN